MADPINAALPLTAWQQTVKGSPFGGSDLFSSDSSLFKTTEREKKLSKGLFDDFLSEDSKKSGGGLFD